MNAGDLLMTDDLQTTAATIYDHDLIPTLVYLPATPSTAATAVPYRTTTRHVTWAELLQLDRTTPLPPPGPNRHERRRRGALQRRAMKRRTP